MGANKPLIDLLPEITKALENQLLEDEKRWGDTWRHRIKDGQETRIFAEITNYYDQFKNAGVPIPWLKVMGMALIAWVRENHPELLYTE